MEKNIGIWIHARKVKKFIIHWTETCQNARWFSSSVAATKAMAAKATVAESGTTNAAADTVAMERLQVIY